MIKKIKPGISLLALLIAGSFLIPAIAADYVVTNASELNGLFLNPGDVVLMKDGIWQDQQLVFRGVGTAENPITLKAETAGEVILTGSSYLRMSGEYLVVDGLLFKDGKPSSGGVIEFRSSSSSHAFNSRLTNTAVINYNPPSKDTEYKWVSIYGKNNRVDHCHFEGKIHNGALLVIWLDGQANYHRIDHNYFGKRPDLGYNGGEIIRIGTSDYSMSDSYSIVENNLFEDCDGEIEIISNKSCKNIYRNNTFRNSKGTLTLRHGNDCEVYNNFFFGDVKKACGGIRIIGENHKVYNNYLQDIPGDGYRSAICLVNGVLNSPLNRYFQVINAEVVNNTIVHCYHPFLIGAEKDSEKSEPPKDCIISNNVVSSINTPTPRLVYYEDEPLNMKYQSNIMYGAALGIPEQSGIEIIDPGLIESDFWRPADTSAAIAYGVKDFSYMTFDIDGQERAGDMDAGCDQLSEEPHTNFPLEKEDVGVDFPISTTILSEVEKVLRIYPNPSDGNITLESLVNGVLYIYNSAGILVYHQTINFTETKLDLSYLPAGLYLINLHTEGSTFRQILIRR